MEITPERVEVTPLPHGLEALVGPQMRAKPLELAIGGCGTGAGLAGEEKLRRILLNLLTNALKFTPPGGRVDVSCERVDGEVRIHVRDTGRGIPAPELESVFEPFVQVDRHVAPHDDQGGGAGAGHQPRAGAPDGRHLSAESEMCAGSVHPRHPVRLNPRGRPNPR